jgi:hypothetical protein
MQQHGLSGNASLNQPNRLDRGGARLSGNRSAARVSAFSSKYINIFLIVLGFSMQAKTLAVPVNPSTCIQVITLNSNHFLTDANIDESCNRTHYGSNRVVCVGKSILAFYN